MLKIQRASAGSGKTYALAQRYILDLIAFRNSEGKWMLRNERQIEDALQHILAITFTNKATNEMKQRIIHNLALLSEISQMAPLNEKKIMEIPYLQYFHELTGAEYKSIGLASQYALRSILNNYSLFKISTIDSFFQEILRTFTFEANLNNSYQLEIDSAFITDTALDSAIQELDHNPDKMGKSAFWIKTIMHNEAKKSQQWNPFNKKVSARSLYGKIRNAIFQIENEDFKGVRNRIDKFFADPDQPSNLLIFYRKLKEYASAEREILLKKIIRTVNQIENEINKGNLPKENLNSHFIKHLAKAVSLKTDDPIPFKYDGIVKEQSVFKKKYRSSGNPLDIMAMDFYGLVYEWENPSPDSYYKNWKIYGELLPYFGLILEIRSFLSDVLKNNNLIRLGDTSYILKKIIGEEDAPFVYERLGNRIDHYLIDEFQDTSQMQWDVIYPLLNEGVSKGLDSLIIGDPKQSIYRFRNAKHTLITNIVPDKFPNHISAGFSAQDNTNWRSHTNIVKFNNFFFKVLTSEVNRISKQKGNSTDFLNLYSNVVQFPHNQLGKGYIEIRTFDKKDSSIYSISDELENEEIPKDWFDVIALKQIGPLVSSLLKRGYNQKDVGILVNTNEKGKQVVESLVAYNETLKQDEKKIDFISEESFLINSSAAVQLIIGVLEKLSNPGNFLNHPSPKGNDNPEKRIYYNWNKIEVNYKIFSKQHGGLTPAEKIISFLNNSDFNDSIAPLLENMPVPSLTALIESIIKAFVDDDLKKKDAIFLSSFQDIVTEYSSNFHNDPASFLEWWRSRGCKTSVSSPEGIDAVQIMTIHKSKGLEFKCVIVPFANDSLTPDAFKKEWRWVETQPLKNLQIPPILPVSATPVLKGSVHEHIYKEYFDQVLTDRVNMYYVAFTRAKNELYIFTKNYAKNPTSINDFLIQIMKGIIQVDEVFTEQEYGNMISLKDIQMKDEENILCIGEPFSRENIEMENIKESKNHSITQKYFNGYFINERRPKLRSIASKTNPSRDFMN